MVSSIVADYTMAGTTNDVYTTPMHQSLLELRLMAHEIIPAILNGD